MLAEFIAANREEIVTRYRSKAAMCLPSVDRDTGSEYSALVFIEELLGSLRDPKCRTPMLHRGDTVLEEGLIVPRVNQYRDICHSIAELAMEMDMPINVDDFANLEHEVVAYELDTPRCAARSTYTNPLAWQSTQTTRTGRYRINPSRDRFNDFPPQNASRSDS